MHILTWQYIWIVRDSPGQLWKVFPGCFYPFFFSENKVLAESFISNVTSWNSTGCMSYILFVSVLDTYRLFHLTKMVIFLATHISSQMYQV